VALDKKLNAFEGSLLSLWEIKSGEGFSKVDCWMEALSFLHVRQVPCLVSAQ